MLEEAVKVDIANLENGLEVLPWGMLQCAGVVGLETFVVGGGLAAHEVLEAARNVIRERALELEAYVLCFDGKIATSDGPVRGLFYELGERGQPVSFRYMRGYDYETGKNREIKWLPGWDGMLNPREPLLP